MTNRKEGTEVSLTLEYIITLFLIFLCHYLQSLTISFLARVNSTKERITGILFMVVSQSLQAQGT